MGRNTPNSPVVLEKAYDYAAPPACGGTYTGYLLQPNVTLHDDANYGLSFSFRGNLTQTTTSGYTVCQSFDYLGAVRSATGPFGTTTTTPDATKQYAVPSAITTNGYSTSLQWDGLLNLTQSTGPNSATVSFGYDAASRPASTQGVDGDAVAYTYSTPNRYSMATTGKKFVKTSVDGLGRAVKVATGYNPSPGTSVVESVVDTEYAPCACTPMGKMKRVSQPYKPGNPVVWTTYTYDELGRALTVTHPPNTGSSGISGTTSYLYTANTVKITDPAGRWKKYTMDGYGNLTRVDEPKPASGTYVTTYTYSEFNQLKTVSMNRDGYNGNTPLSVNQTRTFAYDANQRLQSTTFPETPGSTTYTYNADGMIATKTDYKGIRKYFYTAAKQLQRVEKYPGGGAEDVNARVTYYYDSHPFTTTFVSQYTQGRLAAIEYGAVREFYSYTRGGRLVKKRLESQGVLLEVGFEYDAEAKLQYMVYPSGTRVKYTYDDLARHTGLKSVQGLTETDLVNNLTYGAAGELKSMSWSDIGGWATQNWAFNNRLQMTGYTYGGPGGSINHSYLYSTTANDGKLWRRQDNVSGEVVEYQYDSIHRLTSATTVAGTAWSQSYVLDGFGNMKQKIGTGLAVGTSFNISLNSAKNGGGTGDPGDIDNRIVTGPTGETYSYAPDNKRIAKTLTGGAGTQWFLWVGGMRIGTYTHNWNSGTSQWVLASSKEDWYVAGRRVAPSDRLGSDLTGGLKLMPYGEEIQPPNVPNDKTKFATYHRDASGLDYADQRYYSPGTGRFMSSDPYLASGGAASPSSWNRYAYTRGDPVNRVDPEGLQDEGPADIVDCGSFGKVPADVCRFYLQATGRPDTEVESPSKRQELEDRKVARAARNLYSAVNAARKILSNNQDCFDFLSGGMPGIDPLAVLNRIVDGTLGSFQVTEIPDEPGVTTSATASAATMNPVDIGNGATQLQTATVLIRVNYMAGDFVNGGSSARSTVLHELGHAIYLLYGAEFGSGLLSESYGIKPDGKTLARSKANQEAVNKHCR